MKAKIWCLSLLTTLSMGCQNETNQTRKVNPETPTNTQLDVEDDSSIAQSCTVNQTAEGAVIVCPDGSQAVVENGNDGANGADGTNGIDGKDGINGVDGQDGEDGSSCTIVSQSPTTATIACTDGSVSELNLAVPMANTIGGMILWLDASDSSTLFKNKNCTGQASDGNEVLCWKDKSDGLKVTARSERGPVIDADKVSLDFRATSQESMEAVLKDRLNGDDYTVFMVADLDVPASDHDGRFLTLLGKSVGNEIGSSSSSIPLRRHSNTNELISSQKNSNSKAYQKDPAGMKIFTVSMEDGKKLRYQDSDGQRKSKTLNSVSLDVDRIRLMNGSDRYGQGHVHEVIVYDRRLTQSEHMKVYTELLLKWGF